jgi:hypothetical protein
MVRNSKEVAMSSKQSVTQRIDALERRMKQERLVMLILALMVLFRGSPAAGDLGSSNVVKAERFILQSPGKPGSAELRYDTDGGPELVLIASEGKERVTLHASPNGNAGLLHARH